MSQWIITPDKYLTADEVKRLRKTYHEAAWNDVDFEKQRNVLQVKGIRYALYPLTILYMRYLFDAEKPDMSIHFNSTIITVTK